ncbi:MAG: class I SAM-dependent methyltransferase [Thermoanaerobaculia bacterium]
MSESERLCPLCGDNRELRRLRAREAMYATGETFWIKECTGCGSLVLLSPVSKSSGLYQGDYYSFLLEDRESGETGSWILTYLRGARDRRELYGRGFLGRLAAWQRPDLRLRCLRAAGVNCRSHILDVGSGSGALVRRLRRAGFANSLGVDPYVPETVRDSAGALLVAKATIDEMDGKWDAILLNHVLEHTRDPRRLLAAAAERLSPLGVIIVRTPIVPNAAWQRYGTDWIQIDAPRHEFIPSIVGLRSVSASVGLEVEDLWWDSTAFQFWGSEMARRGVPLNDGRRRPLQSLGWSRRDFARATREAAALNARGMGDQVIAIIRAGAPRSIRDSTP